MPPVLSNAAIAQEQSNWSCFNLRRHLLRLLHSGGRYPPGKGTKLPNTAASRAPNPCTRPSKSKKNASREKEPQNVFPWLKKNTWRKRPEYRARKQFSIPHTMPKSTGSDKGQNPFLLWWRSGFYVYDIFHYHAYTGPTGLPMVAGPAISWSDVRPRDRKNPMELPT